MVDAIVASVVEQLISFVAQEAQEEVRLVAGVDKQVSKLTDNFQAIQAVLVDAEQRQLTEQTVKVWLDKLKDASYNMEDVLDVWNTARLKLQIEGVDNALAPQKKVCSFLRSPCFCFKQVILRRDIAHKIKEINENLDDIAKRKDTFNFKVNLITSVEQPDRAHTTSLIEVSEVCGREEEKNTLVRKLLSEGSEGQNGLHIISLVGMGGMGKTTVAQLAYNNNEVIKNFDNRIWVCVSDPFDKFRVAKAIIEGLKCPASNLGELESLIQTIREFIIGKKFFLVLDDVWEENFSKWEPFYLCLRNGSRGSKILITTRKETVAGMMRSTDIISINKLAEEECWSLFKQLAFFRRPIEECEKLEQIGRKIASKCNGLPLAAKTIGSLLRSKYREEEWQYIVDSELWEQKELEKGLFAPLLLSYNDLPSMVKSCFTYCSIFPKDYEIEKDELIKLWMAQGYLSLEKNKEMEIIGEEYFDILATRSFFQDFGKDDLDNIRWCKMHDIVHDFAQFVSKNECFTIEVPNSIEEPLINSFHKKVCHSMLTFGYGDSFPVSICRFRSMRSLLIRGSIFDSSSNSEVPVELLFGKLTCLRALDLRAEFLLPKLIREIPRNIEKLVHLRYINFSWQGMEKLPETLCELYNLQILDVSFCEHLKELPQGIGKLINLRYLLNDNTPSLWLMPVGIARLTNLRRLTKFVHDSQGCTLGSLKNLNFLQECCINGLGTVSDVDEAKRLELEKMKNLLVLGLNFCGYRGGEDVRLFEALQAPLNLKELEISFYKGDSIFPNWMMSLNNMRVLRLQSCENWENLPPVGKLPSLEILCVSAMQSLKKVGNEFLGIESSSSSSSSSFISFPKLKSLQFFGMNNWEEWEYEIDRKGEIMPRLSRLEIEDCPKLKALPDHLLRTTTLQTLEIEYCDILSERYREGTGEDWQKISHIPNINIIDSFRFQRDGIESSSSSSSSISFPK